MKATLRVRMLVFILGCFLCYGVKARTTRMTGWRWFDESTMPDAERRVVLRRVKGARCRLTLRPIQRHVPQVRLPRPMQFTQRQTLLEWGFLAAMVGLCSGLTALQYRWTGELAHAEVQRLRGNLTGQSQLLAQDFDNE